MLLAVPLIIILMAVVALAGAAMARATSDAFNSWLGKILEAVATPLIIPGARASLELARWIAKKLGDHFEGVERLSVAWFAALAQYADTIITTAIYWPIRLGTVVEWLIDVEIPRIARAFVHTTTTTVSHTVSRVVRIERTVVQLPKLTRKQAQLLIGAAVATYIAPYLYPLRWLRTHFHALTAVLPHALPVPFGRTIAGIKARLRRLERVSAGGLAVAAVVAALVRIGLGFLRCGNVKRAGKRLCGMDASLLDSLLLDTVAIFSVLSVVEFAHELRAVEDEAVTLMGRLVREFPSPPSRA